MTESPFQLLLLLDTSASTAPSLKLIRAAATHFTRQLQTGDRLAVATFDTTVHLRQGFTEDHSLVREVIEGIESQGNTKLYDAVHTTLQEYMPALPGRKAVVLFTDGADNSLVDPRRGSSTTFAELVTTTRRSDCVIYPVFLSQGTPLGREARVAARAISQMRQLAEETGGRLYNPKGAHELKKIYGEIAEDLRSMYTLIYRPPLGPEDSWREVIVTVKRRPEFQVRTRRGYMYNVRQSSPQASAPGETTERSE
jgi:VWFA-related protein